MAGQAEIAALPPALRVMPRALGRGGQGRPGRRGGRPGGPVSTLPSSVHCSGVLLRAPPFKVSVLVSWGCCIRAPQTWGMGG